MSKLKKVKCPKKKKVEEKKETKYTLAFHAEGKKQAALVTLPWQEWGC